PRPAAAAAASVSPVAVHATRARAPAAGLSPAVRRLLSERGLDPSAVRGTGPAGRITVEDVLRAAPGSVSDRRRDAAAARAPAAGAPVSPAGAPAEGVGSHRVPHTAVRKRIADHMVQSLLHTAPHVTTVFEADMSGVLTHRARQRDEFARRGAPLTLTAYFVQAAVAAIRAVPEANSRWTDAALEIYDSIHIGVATAVEGVGLVVPVLHDAQARDLFDTARALDELVTRARAGKLSPADVRGGTFTISNHGVSGSLLAAPIIINQPQAAILGVGKLEKRPVVVEEGDEQKIVARPRCYVTLTLDHRVMDGHQANHFLQVFVQKLTGWPA
ncbi:MAG: 2-oxo acid dehydrogenase subunit E2, partial [Gammaproteobacteria bacterium]